MGARIAPLFTIQRLTWFHCSSPEDLMLWLIYKFKRKKKGSDEADLRLTLAFLKFPVKIPRPRLSEYTVKNELWLLLPWHRRSGFRGCTPENDTPQMCRWGKLRFSQHTVRSTEQGPFSTCWYQLGCLDLSDRLNVKKAGEEQLIRQARFIRWCFQGSTWAYPEGRCCPVGWGFLQPWLLSQHHQMWPLSNQGIFQMRKPGPLGCLSHLWTSPYKGKDLPALQWTELFLQTQIGLGRTEGLIAGFS